MGTPMWKRIEQTRKQQRDLKLPCGFDTLEDVLKSIRDYPKVVTRDRQELRYANAFEFFNGVDSLSKLLSRRKDSIAPELGTSVGDLREQCRRVTSRSSMVPRTTMESWAKTKFFSGRNWKLC